MTLKYIIGQNIFLIVNNLENKKHWEKNYTKSNQIFIVINLELIG